MQAILNIAIRGVRKAGAYLLRERDHLGTACTEAKILSLQQQAELIIKEHISKAYPDHNLIASHNDLPEKLADTVWYIEVVSGYENLLRNIPHYSFVISIEEKSKVKYSLIYDPHSDEIFTAAAGGGAQCNSSKLRVTQCKNFNDAIVATTTLQSGSLKTAEHVVELNAKGAALYNQGCSALNLAYVAAGRIDAFYGSGLSQTVLNAGVLLIKESGGLVADLTGAVNFAAKGELLAANSKLLKLLVQLLN